MVSKKFVYDPIGDEVSKSTALIQAAAALDVATNLAVESRDIESLSSLSCIWMELAARLANGGIPPEHGFYDPNGSGEDEEDDEGNPIGFTAKLRGEECQD